MARYWPTLALRQCSPVSSPATLPGPPFPLLIVIGFQLKWGKTSKSAAAARRLSSRERGDRRRRGLPPLSPLSPFSKNTHNSFLFFGFLKDSRTPPLLVGAREEAVGGKERGVRNWLSSRILQGSISARKIFFQRCGLIIRYQRTYMCTEYCLNLYVFLSYGGSRCVAICLWSNQSTN